MRNQKASDHDNQNDVIRINIFIDNLNSKKQNHIKNMCRLTHQIFTEIYRQKKWPLVKFINMKEVMFLTECTI